MFVPNSFLILAAVVVFLFWPCHNACTLASVLLNGSLAPEDERGTFETSLVAKMFNVSEMQRRCLGRIGASCSSSRFSSWRGFVSRTSGSLICSISSGVTTISGIGFYLPYAECQIVDGYP